jgi:LuxR family transcriptional regulator, maltose regulon positive regulatory protein
VRAADLRFTATEAGQYLRTAMGLSLDEDQVAALDQRTEGWIAALQLAALSMQGRTDVGEFVASFRGDDRYLVDYLVEEVLQRQSEAVRRFLLETSILQRLTDVRLQDAEQWLERHADDAEALDGRLRTVPSNVAMYRAGQARLNGDVAATIDHAKRAHDLSSDQDHLERGAAAALLGLAHWSTGRLEDARRGYAEALQHLSEAGHLSDVLGCTLASADIEVARGDLNTAFDVLELGLRTAQEAPHPPRGIADMHVGLAALHVERNELDAALEHLAAGDDVGKHAGLPQNAYRSRVALAQVRVAQNAPDAALRLLAEAARVHDSDYSPDIHPVAAHLARTSLACGRLDQAEHWARSRGLTVDDEPSYLTEFEHLTLARLLLCRARTRAETPASGLSELLARLLVAAEEQRRAGSAIEVLVLPALHAQLRGEAPRARSVLAEAVRRAEPQQYVRTITEHGSPVPELLHSLPNLGPGGYVRHLLESAEGPDVTAEVPLQRPPDR